jgi:hypothetical protein
MKLIYIDDSGNTGKKLDDEKQPIFVLGGVVVDENDWHAVDHAISELKSKYDIEEEIHAIDIMNGKGCFKNWDYKKKMTFMKELLMIIPKFNLRVIEFSVRKANFRRYFEKNYGKNFNESISISPYLLAFSYLLEITDSYLIQEDAHGILIFDEQDEFKKPATKTFRLLRTIVDEPELKLEKLLERSFFVESHESNMLQLADVVAYTIKRYEEIDIREDVSTNHKKIHERESLYEIYLDQFFEFDYSGHKILEWLEIKNHKENGN